MLEHTMIILRVFDVFSHIYKPPKQETNNRGSLEIKQLYTLCIYGRQSRKLSYVLNMKIKHKQDGCELLKKHEHMFEHGKRFEMIPNEIDGEIVMEERNGRFIDTVFSKIKTIEEVKNTTAHAYDLTVNLTKTLSSVISLILPTLFIWRAWVLVHLLLQKEFRVYVKS